MEDGRRKELEGGLPSVEHLDVAFCVGCNYQPRAAALAETLRKAFPAATVTLTPTGGGAFEVSADGIVIFSKHQLGRHAQPGEVLRLLQGSR